MGSSAEGFSLAPVSVEPRRDPRMYYDEWTATWRVFEAARLDEAAAWMTSDEGEYEGQLVSRYEGEALGGGGSSDGLDGVAMRSLFAESTDGLSTADGLTMTCVNTNASDNEETAATGNEEDVPICSLFSPLFDDDDNSEDGLDGVEMRSLFSSIFDKEESSDEVEMRSLFSPLFDGKDEGHEEEEEEEEVEMRSLFSPLFATMDQRNVAAGKQEDSTEPGGSSNPVELPPVTSPHLESFLAQEDAAGLTSFLGSMFDQDETGYVETRVAPEETGSAPGTREAIVSPEESSVETDDEMPGLFFEELREATMALVREDQDETDSRDFRPVSPSRPPPPSGSASGSSGRRRNRPRRHPTALRRIAMHRKDGLRDVDRLLQALCRDTRFAQYSLEGMRRDLVCPAAELAGHYRVRVLRRGDDQLVLQRTAKDRLPASRDEIEALLQRDDAVARDAGRLFARLTGSATGSSSGSRTPPLESTAESGTVAPTAESTAAGGPTDATLDLDEDADAPIGAALPPAVRIVDEFISPGATLEKPTPRRLRQKPHRPPRRHTPRRLFTSAQEELQEALREHKEEDSDWSEEAGGKSSSKSKSSSSAGGLRSSAGGLRSSGNAPFAPASPKPSGPEPKPSAAPSAVDSIHRQLMARATERGERSEHAFGSGHVVTAETVDGPPARQQPLPQRPYHYPQQQQQQQPRQAARRRDRRHWWSPDYHVDELPEAPAATNWSETLASYWPLSVLGDDYLGMGNPGLWDNFDNKNSPGGKAAEAVEDTHASSTSSEQVVSSELGVLPKEPKRLRFSLPHEAAQMQTQQQRPRALVDDPFGESFAAIYDVASASAAAAPIIPPEAFSASPISTTPDGPVAGAGNYHNYRRAAPYHRPHQHATYGFHGKRQPASTGLRRRKNAGKRHKPTHNPTYSPYNPYSRY
jgi:hypothetical protein